MKAGNSSHPIDQFGTADGKEAMHIDHKKLEQAIAALLEDVQGVWSTSQIAIGAMNGAVIRIEVLDAKEAERQGATVHEANRCIS